MLKLILTSILINYGNVGIVLNLVIALVISILVLLVMFILGFKDEHEYYIKYISVLVVIDIFLVLLWLIISRCPKAAKNKFGFVVALYCENEEEKVKIKSDFIDFLEGNILNSKVGKYFSFIEIPDYYCRDIKDGNNKYKLLRRSKSNYLIFGKVKLRKFNDHISHVIDLDGIVVHRPTSEKVQKHFRNEFGELFPKRYIISEQNDFLKFEFTADLIRIISNYIIGISFSISGLNLLAEEFYCAVEKQLKSADNKLPSILKIKERLPLRFYETYSSLAQIEYKKWLDCDGSYKMAIFGEYVKKWQNICLMSMVLNYFNHYGILLMGDK